MTDLNLLPLTGDQFLSQITDHSPDVIYTLSRSGRFTYISPAFQSITEWPVHEWLGKRFYPLIHAADLPKTLIKFALTISGKTPEPFEIRVLTKSGHYVIGKLYVKPLKKNGRTIGLLGIGKDLTAWKEQEKKYLVSTHQLSVVVQNVADAITVQDSTGTLILVNDAAAKATGYASPAEMIADPLGWTKRFKLFDEDGQPLELTDLPGRRAIQTKRDTQLVICFENTETKEKRWSLVKARPVLDHKRNIIMVINIVHDFTDQYLMDQRKDTFINMISHELKTPLTSMFLYLELMEKRIKNHQDPSQLLSKLYDPANRLLRLIDEFLDLSRIQTGKLQLKTSKFRLDSMLADQIEVLQTTTTHHTIQYQNRKAITITADRDHLTQVITNLLDNAIKYSPDGGTIALSATKEKGEVIIKIRDEGLGIPKSYRDKIFERLFQVAENRSHQEGLGMGLFISSQIIKKHGGKIWVRSHRGPGSTFYISLPTSPKNS